MIRVVLLIVASAIVAIGFFPMTYAADSLVPAMGHGIAQQKCTTCHLIEPGQVNPPEHVGGPSFQTIANSEDVTVAKLRKHLTKSNRRVGALIMPNQDLTSDELNKLTAYILSLRQAQPAAEPAAK